MEILLNTICALSIGYAAYVAVALVAHIAKSVRVSSYSPELSEVRHTATRRG